MRALGIDYGDKRIGLAISDALGLAAHGLPTLENKSEDQVLQALKRIVEERNVDHIVVGLPRNMDGSLGAQARKAMQFADRLKSLGCEVLLVDERLTTERARRAMEEAGLSHRKRRSAADRVAAQFILQMHLDSARRA